MFSYLTDKDLFAEIYRNQLAKRLLNQRSASDDMEKLMIGKLKLRFVVLTHYFICFATASTVHLLSHWLHFYFLYKVWSSVHS